jgi:hypothetical protein
MKYLEIFEQYQQKYQSVKEKSSYPYTKRVSFDKTCNILLYEGVGDAVFLVAPSIFNSHDILTIGAPNDMITNLRTLGSVYLIEWLEVEDKDFGLEDYAEVVVGALDWVVTHVSCHSRAGGNPESKASQTQQTGSPPARG